MTDCPGRAGGTGLASPLGAVAAIAVVGRLASAARRQQKLLKTLVREVATPGSGKRASFCRLAAIDDLLRDLVGTDQGVAADLGDVWDYGAVTPETGTIGWFAGHRRSRRAARLNANVSLAELREFVKAAWRGDRKPLASQCGSLVTHPSIPLSSRKGYYRARNPCAASEQLCGNLKPRHKTEQKPVGASEKRCLVAAK